MITHVSTVSVSEPVTIREVKDHLRITTAASDTVLANMITTARQQAEDFMRRTIMPSTIVGSIDSLCGDVIDLPFPPLRSVTSITYIDNNGDQQTVAPETYSLDIPGMRILRAYGQSWPRGRAEKGSVKITYVAGYESIAAVPEKIKTAIILLVEYLYDGHEPSRNAAEAMLWPSRDLR